MNVTSELARWSQSSNRRRGVEAAARAAPWMLATAAVVLVVAWHAGPIAAIPIGVLAAATIVVGAVRHYRAHRHASKSIARALDRDHRTVDLLETALAIEARGADDPLEAHVVATATARIPQIRPTAVAPLKLRASPAAGVTALAATALLLLTGIGSPAPTPDAPVAAIDPKIREKAKELEKVIDELAKDKSLSADVRSQLNKAKEALKRAAEAKTATEALAALSDAQRTLDELAPKLAADNPDELAKMSTEELANELAKSTAAGDKTRTAALAKEALRRAATSPAAAKELASAMKSAASKAGGKDPWAGKDGSPAGQRLEQLARAADQLAQNDLGGARAELSDLAKSMPAGAKSPSAARAAKLASASKALSDLRSATRTAMNSGTPGSMGAPRPMSADDARASAARDAARSGSRPGAGTRPGMGSKPGSGMGKGPGTGPGMGSGMGPGTGPGTGKPGTGPGGPGSGPPPPGGGVGVMMPSSMPGSPGGAAGTSGAKGSESPSGAQSPDDVGAEEVTLPPPTSPEGVIRAIAEHAMGDHRSEAFGPVRDRYEAIAEGVIRRDEIPLTRRDFIQRYFEALRTHEENP